MECSKYLTKFQQPVTISIYLFIYLFIHLFICVIFITDVFC